MELDFLSILHQMFIHKNLPHLEQEISCKETRLPVVPDYILDKYCKSYLGLIEAQEYNLGEENLNGKTMKHSYQYVPILDVLKSYLGHNDVRNSIQKGNMQPADSDLLTDYMSGSHFKDEKFFQDNPGALRLVLYTDEFEVVNPLGGKRGQQKMLAVYFVVDNVERSQRSTLKNIHLALLVKYKVAQKYGYSKVMRPLIDDLVTLETQGITVRVNGLNHHCVGTVITVSADNLSSHAIGGFSSNFSSGRICRFCMASKREICTEFDESQYVLRTPDVHKYHLEAIIADRVNTSVYGVTGPCVFAELGSFEVTKSLPPDVMHDLLEGVVPVVIKIVLKELPKVCNGVITYEKVGQCMKAFKYGKNDAPNKPPVVSANTLQKNNNIAGSAAQKLCLFRLLSLAFAKQSGINVASRW